MVDKYKWTQENTEGLVTTSHGADVLQNENEIRRILHDLGKALSHSKFNDNSYPRDETSGPYVRGATSDDDYEISVAAGKVIKITSRESGGNKTLYLKYDATKGILLFSNNGTDYYEFLLADITSPYDGDFLKYDGYSHKWVNVQPHLSDLVDVNISSPQNGDYLKYNGTSAKWENSSS